MSWKPCMPRPNVRYRNVSGDEYRCLADFQCRDTIRRIFGVDSDFNDIPLDRYDGVFERISDHWLLIARNVQVNEDGDICWGHSIRGRWRRPGEPTYGEEN